MDVRYSNRTVHLPQEVVQCIVCNLRTANDIRAARLVNQAFCSAATELMLDILQSPSELFTHPTSAEIEEVEQADPQFFKFFGRRAEKPLTIWTWLRVPPDVTLDDRRTTQGRRFLKLAVAPSTSVCQARLDDEVIDEGKDEVPPSSGRKATCWGRVQEKPDLFCIVMQWHSRTHWNAYRVSTETANLRTFLEDVAPGCVATSISEEVPLPPEHKQHRPLFSSLCEVRTVYFKSSMTAEQKNKIEATQHVRHFSKWRRLGGWEANPGRSVACWLRGLRTRNGERAVAARMVFPQDCQGYLEDLEEVGKGSRAPPKTHAELLEEELRLCGMLESERLHCAFQSGPGWRN